MYVRTFPVLWGVLVLSSAAGGAPGAEDDTLSGPEPVSVGAVLAYARAHAPRLEAAERRAEAARWGVDAAGAWPDARVMVQGNPLPIETRNGPVWGSASMTQPLPWLDVLDADRAAAGAASRGAVEAWREALIEVEGAALVAFHGLALIRAEAAINAEMLAIARRLLGLVEDRVGVDRARVADALQAQVEVARLETAAADLAQRELTRQAALNAAVGRAVRAPVGPLVVSAAPPTEALDALLDAAAAHPVLAASEAQLAVARARLRSVDARGRPMFSVGLGYTLVGEPAIEMGAPAPGRDGVAVQLGVTVPLWAGSAYDAEAQAAAARVGAEERARAAAVDVIAQRVVEQAVRTEVALRQLRLYRDTALPLSDEALQVLMTAYAADEVEFDRVLAGERARERFALAAARAEAEFWMARAMLAVAVGRSPTSGDERGPGAAQSSEE